MRAALLPFAMLLVSCASEPKPAATAPPEKADSPKPADESRRFPLAHQVGTQVVDKNLLDERFMPGGTLALYKKGKLEYSMFVAKLAGSTDAAVLLLDWQKTMTGAKLIPSFGGYFGENAGRPVFVFTKGAWIAGVAGLPEKEADLEARNLAAHLD